MSLVSVCVPVYNGEKYLRESLDSILNQTYTDIEVLVVDDCSTDNSVPIVRDYQSKDDRIRLIEIENNLGLVGNWNRCIAEAKGEWLKLHFQDDLMVPDTIEKMMALALKKQVRVVLTDREYKFEHQINDFYINKLVRLSDFFTENAVVRVEETLKILVKNGIRMNFMGEPILGLVHKQVFEEIGLYDHSFKQISDFEFWLRIGLNMDIGFIPERLHTFRLHNASQSSKNSNETGINPSHIDRIMLASKLHSDPAYQGLRALAGDRFTQGLIVHFMSMYTKRYTRAGLAVHLSQEYLDYLNLPLWKRLLYRLNLKKLK